MKKHIVLLMLAAPPCLAQTVSTTETYGPVPAENVYNSLGTNINPASEWEYQAAKALHITWSRFDCPWQSVEGQKLPQNVSLGYQLPKSCASGLAFGKQYGIHQMVDALYGAPYGRIVSATTLSDAPAGSTNVSLQAKTGSLDSVVPGQTYLKFGSGNVSAKRAYAGTLIASKTGNTVTLASKLTTAIPAGSTVILNLQLYPPVLIKPGTSFQNNPSIQAYGNYVHFLQTQVAASGLPGRVSLWNEPPWGGDPWDEAANLYDSPPPETRVKPGSGIELAFYAATLPPVPGAPLDNGYTNKSGNGSIMAPDRRALLQSAGAGHGDFISESIHPYGNNPEDGAWIPACVQAHHAPNMLGKVFQDCTPVGMVQGSNSKWLAAFSAPGGNAGGLDVGITETGLQRPDSSARSDEEETRFDLRQFLTFAGSNVRPILFYRLAGDKNYEWLHPDHSPYPVYTAFQQMMTDIGTIARPPVAPFGSCTQPTVQSYAGTYPLAMVILVGSRPGDRSDSIAVYTWQRSYTSGKWVNLPSPAPVTVSLAMPSNLTVTAVKDAVTMTSLQHTTTNGVLTYQVVDDPVEILAVPKTKDAPPASCH